MLLDRTAFADFFRRPQLILDGALGTELERRGIDTRPPLWSATALRSAPGAVAQIHADYVAAGADILVANTFRTNPRTLSRAGCLADGPRLCALALQLARDAAQKADRPILVAASVAPVEDCYRPERVPDDAVLAEEHATLAAWLADADLLWIETMGTIREAHAAAQAAHAADRPCVVSFVLRENGDLLGGESLANAVTTLAACDPLALGINCIPPAAITSVLPQLRSLTARPLIAYAHIANPRPTPGWSYAESPTPAEYAATAATWWPAGAAIVGGCCGTSPAHIAMLSARRAATAPNPID